MVVRDFYLAKNQTVSDTATVTIAIPVGLKIQSLRVIYKATNGATSNTLAKLNGMVSKIEVVNGSDLLQSCSMQEFQAFNCYHTWKFPQKLLNASAAAVVSEEAIVSFGRYYNDPFYYLDTSRYQVPQIRLTHALTISATAGFATGTGTVTVIARIIDSGAPPYIGFVMRKELANWSTAASGDQANVLPLDWPYLEFLVMAQKTTVAPDTIITNHKLQVDAGRIILYDKNATDLMGENIYQTDWLEEFYVPLSDTTSTFLSDVYYQTGAYADIPGATSKAITNTVTGESVVTSFTTGQAAGGIRVHIWGASPHGCFWLPMGDYLTKDYWFDPRKGVAELKMLSTQGVASATARLCAGQLRDSA